MVLFILVDIGNVQGLIMLTADQWVNTERLHDNAYLHTGSLGVAQGKHTLLCRFVF